MKVEACGSRGCAHIKTDGAEVSVEEWALCKVGIVSAYVCNVEAESNSNSAISMRIESEECFIYML